MFRATLGVLALFVIPSPLLAASVKIEGDGHARIPFEMVGGHVWVRGRLNEADSVWVVIDTGASQSVMDAGLAKRMRLKEHGSHEAAGAGGVQAGSTVSNVTLELAGFKASFRTFDTTDLGAITTHGRHPFEVVLGSELFEACVVRFDYPAAMIDVWEKGHAPHLSTGTQLPLTFIDHHPYVAGELTLPGQAPIKGRFVIDTGSNAALIVSPNDGTRGQLAQSFPRTLVALSRGVGGEVRNRIGRGESLRLGDLTFNRPVVMIPDSTSGRSSAAGTIGNIGGQLLGRCRVTFDYANKTVTFEPGEGFDKPFEADMTGLAVTREPAGFVVRFVNPATPASEAGIQAGDILTRIDGKPASAMDPAALRTLSQQDGSTVEFEFKRGSATQTVTLRLRRLI